MSGYDDTGSYGDRKRGVPAALVQGDGDAGSTVEWQTPAAFFDLLDTEFGPFTLDPATALGYHTSDVILARSGTVCVAPQQTFEYVSLNGGKVSLDGLAHEWTGRVWLNHPYGRQDWRWIKKAHDSVRFGNAEIVVALVPVKTGLKWWRKYIGSRIAVHRDEGEIARLGGGVLATFTAPDCRPARGEYGADELRFVSGRLRFGGAPSSAPFNSAIVVWRK